MRKITRPKPFKVPGIRDGKPALDGKGKPVFVDYTLASFFYEYVLTDIRWRKEFAPEYAEVSEAFAAKGDAPIMLTDAAHECVDKIVTKCEIKGPYARDLMWFVHSITLAARVGADPKEKKGSRK